MPVSIARGAVEPRPADPIREIVVTDAYGDSLRLTSENGRLYAKSSDGEQVSLKSEDVKGLRDALDAWLAEQS